MALAPQNLFVRLHKWAWRQDENFLTEVLAYLLQHLLEQEPEAAVRILEAFTSGFLKLRTEEARLIEVQPQIVQATGRPDLQLRTPSQLVYIEVKVESEVRPDQLREYRRLLDTSGYASTALILLTRYPVVVDTGGERPDVCVRWHQLAEWMEQERHQRAFKPVSTFLLDQFLGFLGTRNMIMGQVTWELAGGVRALRALSDMLTEAAVACGVTALPYGYRNASMGIYLNDRSDWIGIYYDRPEVLVFVTERRRIDKGAAAAFETGEVYEWKDGSYGWKRELNLEAEEVHFFARSKVSQLQLLESFIRECLDIVNKITVPGAALPPNAVEGNEPSPKM